MEYCVCTNMQKQCSLQLQSIMSAMAKGQIKLPLLLSFPGSQVPRQFPYDNLYLERGGDPSKPPDPQGKVKATYGEFTA